MDKHRYAGIDIGTNTILLTVAELSQNGNLVILADLHQVARLGENLGETGIISESAQERAEKILTEFNSEIEKFNANHILACATSAMRRAGNGEKVKNRLERALGSEIRIISGHEEAAYSFAGARPAAEINFKKGIATQGPCLAVDIGGGSTELIYGMGLNPMKSASFNIGSVSLTERFLNKENPEENHFNDLTSFIKDTLSMEAADINKGAEIVGVGGAPAHLAYMAKEIDKFDTSKIDGIYLRKTELEELIGIISTMKPEEIRKKYSIHPLRADVITAGALILNEILAYFKADELKVSTQGLRYGLIYNLIEKHYR